MPRMIDIVKDYLIANGYGGLCHPESECGCFLDDLVPCGDNCMDCKPGHIAIIDGIDVCVAVDDTPNVQIEGHPASGLSLSNAGLGFVKGEK